MRRLAFLLVGLLAVTAQAQDFPTRPIRMIVPYAPGGLPDTMTRIIGPKLSEAFGLDIVHVPFKGMGQAVPALLGGQVSMLFSALPAIEAHVKAGKVKLLAISVPQRSPQAPEVPTIAELGVPGFDFAPEIGLLAPAGTPSAIVSRLAAEVAKAVRNPDVAQRFQSLGIDPVGNTPEAYGAQIRSDYERYGRVVRVSGAKID